MRHWLRSMCTLGAVALVEVPELALELWHLFYSRVSAWMYEQHRIQAGGVSLQVWPLSCASGALGESACCSTCPPAFLVDL